MSDSASELTTSLISELAKNKDFCQRWAYVQPKVRSLLIGRMLAHAEMHKGEHEEVGRFTEFTMELIGVLDTLSGTALIETHAPKRQKLRRNPSL